MSAYYNEHDPFAAAWLRELIRDGLIADGEVDERSIEDVTPDELRPFRQCHFFAGIGVWSLAARLAGIPDDAPLWTGSCPCQPFSAAGKGAGFADERHLWPAFHFLIEQCQPAIIVGEQVAGSGGDAWLDVVSADMEATGYAFGAIETVACGFGAPHKRSRNYWLAHRDDDGRASRGEIRSLRGEHDAQHGGAVVVMADAFHDGQRQHGGRVGDTPGTRKSGPREREWVRVDPANGCAVGIGHNERPGPVNGFWGDADWLRCRDEKWRPVEPGAFPLVDAGTFRNRVGLLRGAGNAITIGQAAGFLQAVVASVGRWR